MMNFSAALRATHALLLGFGLALIAATAQGHSDLYTTDRIPLSYSTEQVALVTGHLRHGEHWGVPHIEVIDGKKCLVGTEFSINVRDEFAFDIDETVKLNIEFHLGATAAETSLFYDQSEGAPRRKSLQIPAAGAGRSWYTQTVMLERARFSGLAADGSDIYITPTPAGANLVRGKILTICGMTLERNYATPVAKTFGYVALEIKDERGRQSAARVGLYDRTGRMPLPGEQAIPFKLGALTRTVGVPDDSLSGIHWPHRNRTAFIVDGQYRARVPAGDYELVISKGPEYRVTRRTFSVRPQATTTLDVPLRRWIDLPARGWYSGDTHIHYPRANPADDRNLLALTQAEDVHVASILHMGNSAWTYFDQHTLAAVHEDDAPSYVLKAGQEDPRTSRRGHTVHLNLQEYVRSEQHYLLYNEVFERTRAQGAVTGYAHVRDQLDESNLFSLNYRTGLALDVPFGLVDILEVLPLGEGAGTLFDYLNLGYKLFPSAGTDCCTFMPGFILPGTVRSYARVQGPFTPQAWYEALKRGETFVSNGPALEFRVNGREMGSELALRSGDKMVIEARASVNPDVDLLHKLELVEQGEVVKTVTAAQGSGELVLELTVPAKHGTWYLLRASGSRGEGAKNAVALSAPIFVNVDGKSFWKPAAVRGIVDRIRQDMRKVLIPPTVAPEEIEPWDTNERDLATWATQKPLLEKRVVEAGAKYDDLVRRAEAELRGEPVPVPRP